MKQIGTRLAYEAMLEAYSRAPHLHDLGVDGGDRDGVRLYDDAPRARVGQWDAQLPSGQACDLGSADTRARLRLIPFNEVCLTPCTTACGGSPQTVQATGDVPSYVVGVYLDPATANFLRVGAISVGTWQLTIASGFGPASFFTETGIDQNQFMTVPLPAAVKFSMVAKLIAGGSINFSGWLKVVSCSQC